MSSKNRYSYNQSSLRRKATLEKTSGDPLSGNGHRKEGLVNEAIKRILLDIVIRGHGDRLIGRWSREPDLQSFLDQVPYMLDRINQLHLLCGRVDDPVSNDHMNDEASGVSTGCQNLHHIQHHQHHHHHYHHHHADTWESWSQSALQSFISLIGDERHWLVRTRDPLGLTPLHKAVLHNNRPIAEYILDRYPDELAAPGSSLTSTVHESLAGGVSSSGQGGFQKLGARLTDAQDKYGRTPLHYAAAHCAALATSGQKDFTGTRAAQGFREQRRRHLEEELSACALYDFLIAKGASMNIRDFKNKPPAYYLRHPGQLRTKSIIHLANRLNANYQANVLTKTLRASQASARVPLMNFTAGIRDSDGNNEAENGTKENAKKRDPNTKYSRQEGDLERRNHPREQADEEFSNRKQGLRQQLTIGQLLIDERGSQSLERDAEGDLRGGVSLRAGSNERLVGGGSLPKAAIKQSASVSCGDLRVASHSQATSGLRRRTQTADGATRRLRANRGRGNNSHNKVRGEHGSDHSTYKESALGMQFAADPDEEYSSTPSTASGNQLDTRTNDERGFPKPEVDEQSSVRSHSHTTTASSSSENLHDSDEQGDEDDSLHEDDDREEPEDQNEHANLGTDDDNATECKNIEEDTVELSESECKRILKELQANRAAPVVTLRQRENIRRCLGEGNVAKLNELLIDGFGSELLKEAGIACWSRQCKRYIDQVVPRLLKQLDDLHETIASNRLSDFKSQLAEEPILARIKRPYRQASLSSLHLSVHYGRDAMVHYLADNFGELIGQRDSHGATCLHWAAKSLRHEKLYLWLLENFSDQLEFVRDGRGKCAADYRQQAIRILTGGVATSGRNKFDTEKGIVARGSHTKTAADIMQETRVKSNQLLQVSGSKVPLNIRSPKRAVKISARESRASAKSLQGIDEVTDWSKSRGNLDSESDHEQGFSENHDLVLDDSIESQSSSFFQPTNGLDTGPEVAISSPKNGRDSNLNSVRTAGQSTSVNLTSPRGGIVRRRFSYASSDSGQATTRASIGPNSDATNIRNRRLSDLQLFAASNHQAPLQPLHRPIEIRRVSDVRLADQETAPEEVREQDKATSGKISRSDSSDFLREMAQIEADELNCEERTFPIFTIASGSSSLDNNDEPPLKSKLNSHVSIAGEPSVAKRRRKLDSVIKESINNNNLKKLEHLILAGCGKRLLEALQEFENFTSGADSKQQVISNEMRNFIRRIPEYMSTIEQIHKTVHVCFSRVIAAEGLSPKELLLSTERIVNQPFERLCKLLKSKQLAVSRDKFGATPIQVALLHCDERLIDHLIHFHPESASAPDHESRNSLHYASLTLACQRAHASALVGLTRVDDDLGKSSTEHSMGFWPTDPRRTMTIFENLRTRYPDLVDARDRYGLTCLDYLEMGAGQSGCHHFDLENFEDARFPKAESHQFRLASPGCLSNCCVHYAKIASRYDLLLLLGPKSWNQETQLRDLSDRDDMSTRTSNGMRHMKRTESDKSPTLARRRAAGISSPRVQTRARRANSLLRHLESDITPPYLSGVSSNPGALEGGELSMSLASVTQVAPRPTVGCATGFTFQSSSPISIQLEPTDSQTFGQTGGKLPNMRTKAGEAHRKSVRSSEQATKSLVGGLIVPTIIHNEKMDEIETYDIIYRQPQCSSPLGHGSSSSFARDDSSQLDLMLKNNLDSVSKRRSSREMTGIDEPQSSDDLSMESNLSSPPSSSSSSSTSGSVERISCEFQNRVRKERNELRAKVDQIMNEIKMSAKSGRSSRYLASPGAASTTNVKVIPGQDNDAEKQRILYTVEANTGNKLDPHGEDTKSFNRDGRNINTKEANKSQNSSPQSSANSSGVSSRLSVCSDSSAISGGMSETGSNDKKCHKCRSSISNKSPLSSASSISSGCSSCSTVGSSSQANSSDKKKNISETKEDSLVSIDGAKGSEISKLKSDANTTTPRSDQESAQVAHDQLKLQRSSNELIDYQMSDSKNALGQTYLHFIASRAQSASTLYRIVERGQHLLAERDVFYRTARDVAVQFNLPLNVQIFDKFIINAFVSFNKRLLWSLLHQGYSPLIHVSDSDGNDIMLILKLLKLDQMVKFLLQMADLQRWRDELHTFIRHAYQAGVSELINRHADLVQAKSVYSRTSVHLAVLFERSTILDELLQKDPSSIHVPDNLGRTPLHYAYGLSSSQEASLIRDKLIASGAKIDCRDAKMRTPKFYFVFKREIEDIKRIELELN